MARATTQTVVSTGRYHPQPRSTPLRDSAAPATATATAAAIAHGCAPAPGRDRADGAGAGAGTRGTAGSASGLALGGQGHRADPRAAAVHRRPPLGGPLAVWSKEDHAAGSDVRGSNGTARQPPRRRVSRTCLDSPGPVGDHDGESVCAEPRGRGQRAGLGRRRVCPRIARIGPRSRWAESLSMSRSSKAAGPTRAAGMPLRPCHGPGAVVRAGQLDGGQALGNGLQAAGSGVFLGLGFGCRGRMQEGRFPGGDPGTAGRNCARRGAR